MNLSHRISGILVLIILSGCADQHYMPDASFTFTCNDGNVHVPSHVTFTHTNIQCEKPYSHYLWYFGDGDSSILTNPTHVFDTVGTFTVSLKMTTDIYTDEKTVVINVLPAFVGVNISNIHLTIPFTQSNSSPWDTPGTGDNFGDPDPYVVLKDGSGTAILTTAYLINELLSPEFLVDVDITTLNDNYTLEIYDYESGPSTLLSIIPFNPGNDILSQSNPYPTSYIKSSGDFSFEMTLQWY